MVADQLLIPVETQYFALEALETLMDVLKGVRETLHPGLRVAGIVPTKHEARVRVCQVTLDLLRQRYPQLLTQTVIRKFVAFPEAQLRGLPIYTVAPGARRRAPIGRWRWAGRRLWRCAWQRRALTAPVAVG